MTLRSYTFCLASLILTFLVTAAPFALAHEAKTLELVAEISGGRQITISPQDYPTEVLAEYMTMDGPRQAQFLGLRQDKLSSVLGRLNGRFIEPSESESNPNGWITKQAARLIKTVDILLFQNCKLLTSPAKEVGTLYSAQAVMYWGIGKRVMGIGMELSLLHHKTPDGETTTTLSLDHIKVVRAYMPIPMASASFRVIRFNSMDAGSDQMESVRVDHLPFGPVTSKGNNHLGLGFGGGLAFPPFPFSTFTGFTAQRVKQKVLWTCANLLSKTTNK